MIGTYELSWIAIIIGMNMVFVWGIAFGIYLMKDKK